MLLNELQERIGYHFGDRSILIQSLTHRSYGHENHQDRPMALRDNERLEFLGDAVLDVVISDILLESFPNAREGQLSKMRAAIVNEKTLADIARAIHIFEYLKLGKGENQTNGKYKASILSSGFEALIAAVYLDGGFSAVYPVVRHLFAPFFYDEKDLIAFYDYKTQLQEMVQARWKVIPTYSLKGTEGPDHAKTFNVEVKVRGEKIGFAKGSSKKEAEHNAARSAIHSFSMDEPIQ